MRIGFLINNFNSNFIFLTIFDLENAKMSLTVNRVVVLARHGARSSTCLIDQFGKPSLENILKQISIEKSF